MPLRTAGNDVFQYATAGGANESSRLRRRLKEIKDRVGPRGGGVSQLKKEITAAVEKDNVEKLLGYGSSPWAGIDRYGHDLAPPADSTIKSWRLRLGRVLAPEGLASRTITRFLVRWVFDGSQWRMVAGWQGIPWMIYHLFGAAKGSKASQPEWSLPRRDDGGLSPRGWVDVRAAFKRFADSVRRASRER